MAELVSKNENTSGFLGAAYDGVLLGDYSDDTSTTKRGFQIGVGLVPIAGQIADVRDTTAALHDVLGQKEGGWGNLAFAAIGWLPLAGDFAKSVRKIGFNETVHSIGDAFSSARQTWKIIRSEADEKLGENSGLFYKPVTELGADDLEYGTLGVTNRYGDIKVAEGLSDTMTKLTLDHEKVHRFFSPQFRPLQNLRADFRLLGYAESHLLRRAEEGLAEAWALFKQNGLSGLREGWQFPYEAGYNVSRARVATEAKVVLGAATTAAATSARLGEASGNNQ